MKLRIKLELTLASALLIAPLALTAVPNDVHASGVGKTTSYYITNRNETGYINRVTKSGKHLHKRTRLPHAFRRLDHKVTVTDPKRNDVFNYYHKGQTYYYDPFYSKHGDSGLYINKRDLSKHRIHAHQHHQARHSRKHSQRKHR